MTISIISSLQSMARKLAAAIHGSSSSDQVFSTMKKDLESLERTLRRIQAVLNDAEKREIGDDSVKLWLKELRWVAYDAENVLGEYQYEIRRAEIITSESAAETSLKRKRHDDQVYEFTSVLLRLPIPQRIRDITERFEEISKARKDLQLREEDGPRRHSISHVPQPSSSLVDEFDIFGQEDDKEAVIQMLLSDKVSSKISVISIVGMGGLGKTTLAQCVYNDPRICQHFNSMGWVCVSDDFDVKRLTGEIIQSITKNSCGLTQLDALQAKLKAIVDGKKLLVVLDDVWNGKPSFWESLKVPFLSATTTRVLVTTRNESVTKMMQTVNNMGMYRLGCLPEDKCWSLFCHHAFSGRNPEEHPRLVEVGRKIVQKCAGLPLAVKTLGSLLLHYETDEESWREVLESEIWELDGAKDDILPALKLSYYRMPAHLKPCFLFTSLYPKDFKFKKCEVIKMWMAQNYILPRGNKRLEDIGNDYFDELQRRSFFLHVDHSEAYVLHDIVHDLARHVSENEHHSVVLEFDGKVCPIPSEVRHLFVRCEQDVTTLEHVLLKNNRDLRTLIINKRYGDNALVVKDHQFEQLVHLRVLALNFQRLPSWIANLKHLGYLHCYPFRKYNVTDLSFLSHLYNMQTLSLGCDCDFVRSIRHLDDLRHLYLKVGVSGSTCLLPSTLEVNLTGSYFMFSKLVEITLHSTCEWVSMLIFSQLPFLRCLELGGSSIQLVGHENYCYCPLHLGNSGDVRNSVITNNVGFPCLEKLIFEDMYKLKEWSGVADGAFPCLRELTLSFGRSLSRLPILPSSLQSLHIFGCYSLKSLPVKHGQVMFPCMQELEFGSMSHWKEWPDVNSGDFPCLRKLRITCCDELKRLPMLPSSLQSLFITECQSLESLPVDKNPGQVRFPCLEEIVFEKIPVLQEEWSGVSDGDFPCLRKLTIKTCHKLRRLPMLPPSLLSLHITKCHSLESLPVDKSPGQVRFPCLEELVFEDIPELQEEWSGVSEEDVPCLSKLTIKTCHKLRRLPMLPPSLQSLHITRCHSLESLPVDTSSGHVRFPCLKKLVFEDIPELQEEWSGVSVGDFPCLRKLIIRNYQKLQGFPSLPSSLRILSIRNCCCLTSLAGLHNLNSLKTFKLQGCPNLQISPEEGLPSKPQHVKIIDCVGLQEWCRQHQFEYIQQVDERIAYGISRSASE